MFVISIEFDTGDDTCLSKILADEIYSWDRLASRIFRYGRETIAKRTQTTVAIAWTI